MEELPKKVVALRLVVPVETPEQTEDAGRVFTEKITNEGVFTYSGQESLIRFISSLSRVYDFEFRLLQTDD